MPSHEGFKPLCNRAPRNVISALYFELRCLLDFQLRTIVADVKQFYCSLNGGALLDVGCGDCAYQHLLPANVAYTGVDTINAEDFDYGRVENVVRYDGKILPFNDNHFDALLCSEVLDHVEFPERLITELYRVLKPGGRALVTLPWSARWHYIPYDYGRYTPSKLRSLFSAFEMLELRTRGSDIVVLCNKLMIAGVRQILSGSALPIRAAWIVFMLMIWPFWLGVIAWAHAALYFNLGSVDDPLGYSLLLRKPA